MFHFKSVLHFFIGIGNSNDIGIDIFGESIGEHSRVIFILFGNFGICIGNGNVYFDISINVRTL